MTLKWTREANTLQAVGVRATYTIHGIYPITRYNLKAIGHDALPLLDLPPYGAQFRSLYDAQKAANELDGRPNFDPQMSGC